MRPTVGGLFFALCLASALIGQDVIKAGAPKPAKIEEQILLLGESVIESQWPHTLDLVNVPKNRTLLNPGQCIRVAVIATGDGRDQYLKETKLAFNVKFAGRDEARDLANLTAFKKIKPEGGDLVSGVLSAVGIKVPEAIQTMVSMGVSAKLWCVPADASDGVANVKATIQSPGGHTVNAESSVTVESFATGAKRAFKDDDEFGKLLMTYYQEPNPARLLPVVEFVVKDQSQNPREGQAEIAGSFVSAALKADPNAAKFFLSRIGAEPPLVRAFGLLAARAAGYKIDAVLNGLSTEEQEKFRSLPEMENPFDLTPNQALFHRLDMMWSNFGATGQYEPVKTIAQALAWRADYDELQKLKNSAKRPTTITPSIVRGVVYTAAGWSLGSFQRNDTVVADYIDYMLASEETPAEIKAELRGLMTNPAFKR